MEIFQRCTHFIDFLERVFPSSFSLISPSRDLANEGLTKIIEIFEQAEVDKTCKYIGIMMKMFKKRTKTMCIGYNDNEEDY